MTFSFRPEAKDEFNKDIEYYENCEPGIGYDFSIEVHDENLRAARLRKTD